VGANISRGQPGHKVHRGSPHQVTAASRFGPYGNPTADSLYANRPWGVCPHTPLMAGCLRLAMGRRSSATAHSLRLPGIPQDRVQFMFAYCVQALGEDSWAEAPVLCTVDLQCCAVVHNSA
jgi:hypothetical protein